MVFTILSRKRNLGYKIILVSAATLMAGCAARQPAEISFRLPEPRMQEDSGKFKEGREPEGFRRIKWGTEISDLENMEFERVDPSFGGVRAYTRKDDLMLIGAAEIEKIEYCFWNGRFSNVWIYTRGIENWQSLKQAFFEAFGEGFQPAEYVENYRWHGNITKIRIEYNSFTEQGTAVIISTEKLSRMAEEIPGL